MRKRMLVQDIGDVSACADNSYDGRIFCCGYEQRSTYVAAALEKSLGAAGTLVLGFREKQDYGYWQRNHDWFSSRTPNCSIVAGYSDTDVFEAMDANFSTQVDQINLLVDYTSMRRSWYAGILNWARFGARSKRVVIDFCYAAGQYDASFPPKITSEIVSVPGCEGHPNATLPSTAIFGLGFDGLAPLTVFDYLEPSKTYAFVASSDSAVSGRDIALEKNREFLELIGDSYIEFPLLSVEKVFSGLAEVITAVGMKEAISLIPLGPKPHVLASIIAAIHFGQVACLHLQGDPIDPPLVPPTGFTSACRVTIS